MDSASRLSQDICLRLDSDQVAQGGVPFQAYQHVVAVPFLGTCVANRSERIGLELQVQQAVRYARAISGKPADVSLAMNQDEGLGGWAALVLVHTAHAMWDEVLAIAAPPSNARGNCPDGGYAYSVVVYHYARTLALAARCRPAPDSDACRHADRELGLLQASCTAAWRLLPADALMQCMSLPCLPVWAGKQHSPAGCEVMMRLGIMSG